MGRFLQLVALYAGTVFQEFGGAPGNQLIVPGLNGHAFGLQVSHRPFRPIGFHQQGQEIAAPWNIFPQFSGQCHTAALVHSVFLLAQTTVAGKNQAPTMDNRRKAEPWTQRCSDEKQKWYPLLLFHCQLQGEKCAHGMTHQNYPLMGFSQGIEGPPYILLPMLHGGSRKILHSTV